MIVADGVDVIWSNVCKTCIFEVKWQFVQQFVKLCPTICQIMSENVTVNVSYKYSKKNSW